MWAIVLPLGCSPPDRPADVVLVSVDTLRADHLSGYGYSRDTSPFLDRLAADGVRFAHARASAPWTLPSHVTMLSGWRSARHMVVEDRVAIPPALTLLPEAFGRAGFATAGFVTALLVGRDFGFARGFDHFDEFGMTRRASNVNFDVDAGRVVDAALAWLDTVPPDRPAFLFLHLYDAHTPYDPPPPHDAAFDRPHAPEDIAYHSYARHLREPLTGEQMAHQVAQYDEAIRYVDGELARLHAAMADRGRRATWAVTADHGEEFGERGGWGHAMTLYAEQLRVPLIVSGERVGEPRVVEAIVGLEDVAPTLAALAGVPFPGADGADALGELPARGFLADTSRYDENRLSWLADGWRLDLDLARGRAALYDVAADPRETRDLLPANLDRAAAMERDAWRRVGTAWEAVAPVALRADGVFVVDGVPAAGAVDLPAGARFHVLPFDAEVDGRWTAVGVATPGPGDPVRVTRDVIGAVAELSPDERARLEALGYLQEKK
ncbi:MAG: sulfatase-like hydrolase/transferase [Myxococcota bacterium]